MRKPLQNVGASVRARLLNLAKERNQPFELLLVRYTLERLLYRLSTSKHRENFALKGAMLMRHWLDDPYRPTRDLDLLGFGDSDPKLTLNLFREICAIEADDAVVFDIDGLAVDTVRDESGYSGLRLKTYATVDGARVRVVIDIGYGDATEPGLIDIEFPVLLDQPAPNVRAYSYETVIAEKFQAMVALGLANTRLKDFYDIWILTQAYEFNDDRLAQAIAATFARRKTVIPTELPDGLTPAFARDPAKQQQWAAFVQEFAVNPGPLTHVVKTLATFLMAHAGKVRSLPAKKQDVDGRARPTAVRFSV
jgi:predicted nucleotidyltransferase component of viral defense system